MSNSSYSRLTGANNYFNRMLKGFGIVTVMNAKVFDYDLIANHFDLRKTKCDEILAYLHNQDDKKLCELKTLKVANVNQEGPTKTVTGGQYTNALIKFGKTATMEIQDALGNINAIEALCGGVVEHFQSEAQYSEQDNTDVLHISNSFGGPKTILGETFFIDQASGEQIKVEIIFYQFLPDSVFNLAQDAEGDATVFDMNGSLGVTDILVGDTTYGEDGVSHGVFYSIMSPTLNNADLSEDYSYNDENGVITLLNGVTATLDNVEVESGVTAVAAGTAGLLVITKGTGATARKHSVILTRPASE